MRWSWLNSHIENEKLVMLMKVTRYKSVSCNKKLPRNFSSVDKLPDLAHF